SRRRHTRFSRDWSSDVCSSYLGHANDDVEWTLNDEAIRNLGYLQMKKTHDVAMVLIERAYGELPAYNYYVGGSQGGREGQAVARSEERRVGEEGRGRRSRGRDR